MQPSRKMWGPIASLLLLTAVPAFPQAGVRGAWIADVNGTRHIYVFKVKGDTVTGTYCSRCDEIDNISIIRDGRIAGDRLSFSLLSTEGGGRWRERKVEGSITSGSIVLRGAGSRAQIAMLKVLDGRLVGLICGPCDTPWVMAPIEDGGVEADRVTVYTVHEDGGGLFEKIGPYRNQLIGTLSKHQLRISAHVDGRPEENVINMTFIGPVAR
ncbi:MAG TPA: hypothetical protein VIY56_19590 [Vicinamibacterales bacterium]